MARSLRIVKSTQASTGVGTALLKAIAERQDVLRKADRVKAADVTPADLARLALRKIFSSGGTQIG